MTQKLSGIYVPAQTGLNKSSFSKTLQPNPAGSCHPTIKHWYTSAVTTCPPRLWRTPPPSLTHECDCLTSVWAAWSSFNVPPSP